MNKIVIIFGLFTIISLASCSCDPEWADPEAHEKTEQLREQYGPPVWYFNYFALMNLCYSHFSIPFTIRPL